MAFLRRVAARRGVQLIQLGSGGSAEQLFKPVALPAALMASLSKVFATAGCQLEPCRFQPTDVAVVLVHDEEVALKRRVEEDERDGRMGPAVLNLVKLYTDGVDDRIRARLYVNVDSPLVLLLLDKPGPMHRAAGRALVAVGSLLNSHVRDLQDVPGLMREVNDSIIALLGSAPSVRATSNLGKP